MDEIREIKKDDIRDLVLEDGKKVYITAKGNPLRFLLISGKPLKSPFPGRGPLS